MLSSAECRAKAARASVEAQHAADEASRAYFAAMAADWRWVAAMAEWQEQWLQAHPSARLEC